MVRVLGLHDGARKQMQLHVKYVGSARTLHIRCLYSMFGREITKHTVIYGVYIRFWPTLKMHLKSAHALTSSNGANFYGILYIAYE